MGELFFSPEAAAGATFTPCKPITGQETAEATDDDGDRFTNGDYAGGMQSDAYNLTDANPKWPNHSKRFTGDTGGYMDEATGSFFDKDNVGTTEALAFPNDIGRDYTSLTRYYRNASGNKTWANAVADAKTDSVGGETGWFLANEREVYNLKIAEGNHTNYIDERIFPFGTSIVWTSTSDKNDSLRATQFVGTTGQMSRLAKTNTRAIVYVKPFLVTA